MFGFELIYLDNIYIINAELNTEIVHGEAIILTCFSFAPP